MINHKKMSKKEEKAKFLQMVKMKHLVPASKELKRGMKLGILPNDCIVLRTNDDTIEILENAKKI